MKCSGIAVGIVTLGPVPRNIDASPFCTEREWREDRLSCSERRTRVGECSMRNYPYPLRLEYRVSHSSLIVWNSVDHGAAILSHLYPQYLEGTLGGTDVYADYCPLFSVRKLCGV